MKALYSEGVIDRDTFQLLEQGWRIRNTIAHGIPNVPPVSPAEIVERLTAFARSLVEDLESRGAE
jgi:uncharacterized protein YutE (UPF0331/DUF86 family)